ncbi:hypothetical protein DPMN_010926 [Dreissena polymorpha]|uniref:Uncharacterized protein n=1 Tax=Dreissena polymorpha TaxID=45954 RepID=A0A9D4N2X5_DREPO|nr:hypothetical protein DPMN_010926 [Dreissena polymorpha]
MPTIKQMPTIKLVKEDIDIAHRVGKFEQNKHRQIIVKLQSRMKKTQIMREKKNLKGEKLYINEDLTRLNQEVFRSVRLKRKDLIQSTWTNEGSIKYRDYHDHVHTIHFSNIKYWLELQWP